MKLCILYHPDSEFARSVEDFEKELRRVTDRPIETLSMETIEGASTAENYDVVNYPAVLVLSDDGQLYKGWQGASLPTVADVISNLNL